MGKLSGSTRSEYFFTSGFLICKRLVQKGNIIDGNGRHGNYTIQTILLRLYNSIQTNVANRTKYLPSRSSWKSKSCS
ncbi:hypothetical protein BC941DRAFT_67022 [Chlamydoabsidia padenii]|nr:hypothetical protein BC941DRAFT_67022 [Chlamydoabsidia padenii]